MKVRILWLSIILLLGITACEEAAAPVNQGTDVALIGNNGTPHKVLVTVELSPTPDVVTPDTSILPSPTATEFPEEIDPTDTPTPYVGTFIGVSEDGTPSGASIAPIDGSSAGVNVSVPGAGFAPTSALAGNCSVSVASTFSGVYTANESTLQQLGCPVDTGISTNLVFQPFERGKMFWRDTRQIYALQPNNSLLIVPDTWQEGLPESDSAYNPPSSNLLQPVRGFGYVWRNNETLRNAIGWATQSEYVLPGFWQTFSNGAMFVGDNGSIYAFVLNSSGSGVYYGPLGG